MPRGASKAEAQAPWIIGSEGGGGSAGASPLNAQRAHADDAALVLVDFGQRARFAGKEEVDEWTKAVVAAFGPTSRPRSKWYEAVPFFNRCPLADQSKEPRCQAVC